MADPNDYIPTAAATAVDHLEPDIPTSISGIAPSMVDVLCQQGFPIGLAEELGNTKVTYPLRFWIVDNSGSMMTSDGQELRAKEAEASALEVHPCTRWKELQTTIEYHISLAQLLGTQTIFRLLNNPGSEVGAQEFCVADRDVAGDGSESVHQALHVIRNATPRGVTPLSQHLAVITERIGAVQSQLYDQSQKAVVVVATDGLPTDPMGNKSQEASDEFIAALRELQTMPVWVVIRLCTSNNDVVEFYNGLDKFLESPLDVIDDFVGEANEIYKANKWLNYTLPLHRCREMGYHHRLFDFLDERTLTAGEVCKFLSLLFGSKKLPHPHEDWAAFEKAVQAAMDKNPDGWNSKTKRVQPWINMKELKKEFAPQRGLRGWF